MFNLNLQINLQNIEEVKEKWQEIKAIGFNNEHLLIRESEGKGLGVFPKKNIEKGEIIEFCHCIIPAWNKKYVNDPGIIKYAYWEGCECKNCKNHGNIGLLLLGNGSIYNSADSQELMNASYFLFPTLALGVFVANKDILKGEEILTWWGQGYYDSWCKKR